MSNKLYTGADFRRDREKLKLTREELGEIVGEHESTIRNRESGINGTNGWHKLGMKHLKSLPKKSCLLKKYRKPKNKS